MKTNAMRILDGLKIAYEVREYDDDGEHVLEKGAAVRMAEKLGVSRKTVSDRIKSLKEKGVIIRVGSDTRGYWNINE